MLLRRVLCTLIVFSILTSCTKKDPFKVVGEEKIFERKDIERVLAMKVSKDLNNWAIHLTRTPEHLIRDQGYVVENKEYVVRNGFKSREFDRVIMTRFSPDSERLAYIAAAEGKWFIFMNDKEMKAHSALPPPPFFGRERFITVSSLIFSPDSKKFAYVVTDGEKSFIVVNGKEYKKYDSILSHIFSPDSEKLAYAAKEAGKWFICFNHSEGKRYDNVSNPIFSPDGSKLLYFAQEEGQAFVVVNEKEGNRYDKIVALPIFSPNSEKFAFFALKNNNIFVVINNTKEFAVDKGPPGSSLLVLSNSLRFSTNSNKLAYKVEYYTPKRGGQIIIISDQNLERYPHAYDFAFSPDGRRFAYTVKEEEKYYVVTDGNKGKRYADINSPLIFSQDNSKLAYVVREHGKSFIVVNDQEGGRYDEIISLPRFCSNNNNILLTAREDDKMFVVVNNEEGKKYDDILASPQFSHDCRKVGYYAREGYVYFRIIEEVHSKRDG